MNTALKRDNTGDVLGRTVAPAAPIDWPRAARTHDGLEYHIRPIRPDDIERDRSFINALSDRSRYNRMLGVMLQPPEKLLDRFVHVDYCRQMALVAVIGSGDDEVIIGVARYGGNPAYAEFAIAIADAWQGKGVGTVLLTLLFDYAKAHGVSRLYGVILAKNAPMLQLAHGLHMTIRPCPQDTSLVEAWRTL